MWGFAGGGMAGAYGAPRRFEEQYHCYSVAYADKAHLEVRKLSVFLTSPLLDGVNRLLLYLHISVVCTYNDKPFLTPSVS